MYKFAVRLDDRGGGRKVPLFVHLNNCMIDKSLVYQAVEEKLAETQYFIVGINVTPDNNIVVEIDSFKNVDIDFCVELTRYIESQFDREIEDYALEVGSAGLTQPFKVLKQYQKNIGNEVEVLTLKGQKINGILTSAGDSQFELEIEKKVKPEGAKRKTIVKEIVPFSYEDVKYTKYIIRFK